MAFVSDRTTAQSPLALSLRREIVASEQLRAKILAWLFAALIVTYLILYLAAPRTLELLLIHSDLLGDMLTLLTAALVFELLVCWRLGALLRRGEFPHALSPYLVTLVETSLPTIALLMLTRVVDHNMVLALPSAMFYFPFIILSTLRLSFLLAFFTGLVAGVEFLLLALFLYGLGPTSSPVTDLPINMWKVFIFLVSGLVAGLVALQIRRECERSLENAQERNRAIEVFGKHVSPQVAEQLLEQQVELGGEVRQVCVMFLDIRDFTARSSGEPPEAVVSYLNSLFDFMIDSVTRHRGIVNKFLGDGFMAIFGAPISDGRDSANAVEASREILARLETYNAGRSGPPTRIGIGLHYGPAVAGTIGSLGRREYTIIGDTVNLASRIESLNKQFNSRVLLSEAVHQASGGVAADAESLGGVTIRGEPEPVHLYKLA